MGSEEVIAQPDMDTYRRAIAVDFQDRGAEIDSSPGSVVITFPGEVDRRVVLDEEGVRFEPGTPDGRRIELMTYAEVWGAIHERRAREARRFLMRLSPWVLVAIAFGGVIWFPLSRIRDVAVFGLFAAMALLWFRHIPTREPYPAVALAGLCNGMSVIVSDLLPPVHGLGAVIGSGIVLTSLWAIKHCGGPEMLGFFRAYRTADPARAADFSFALRARLEAPVAGPDGPSDPR